MNARSIIKYYNSQSIITPLYHATKNNDINTIQMLMSNKNIDVNIQCIEEDGKNFNTLGYRKIKNRNS